MGEDTRQIRREIENTRARMTETVEAIGYRADVKTRTKDAIVDRKDSAMSKTRAIVDRVVGAMPSVPSTPDVSMPEFVPDRDQVKEGARHAVSVAQSNPLGLGAGAVAVGFLVGMALPATRAENEKLGDLSDQLKDQARDAGQEALERGKHVAQEAAQAASETAQEHGRQQGGELAESLRESATEIRPR